MQFVTTITDVCVPNRMSEMIVVIHAKVYLVDRMLIV